MLGEQARLLYRQEHGRDQKPRREKVVHCGVGIFVDAGDSGVQGILCPLEKQPHPTRVRQQFAHCPNPSDGSVRPASGVPPKLDLDRLRYGGQAPVMRPTLYEFAGGEHAFLLLAQAHHRRCLADPELSHPFSHPGQHPQHVERLAAYWAEVLGGPPTYSGACGNQTDLVALHSGNGDMSELNGRFVACFMAAADDAGLPDDPEFRAALRAYMEWAVREFNRYPDDPAQVPAGLTTPRWGWGGLLSD